MLTTLARFQSLGGGSGVPSDRALALLRMISRHIERACKREFGYKQIPTSAPEYHEGGGYRLYLRRYPILAVEQVLCDGREESGYSVDPQDWEDGELCHPDGWPARHSRIHTLTNRPIPASLRKSIAVAYTGGYILPAYADTEDPANNPDGLPANLPEEIEQAVWESAITLANGNPAYSGLKREKTPGGAEWEWAAPTSSSPRLTPFAQSVVEEYTRIFV